MLRNAVSRGVDRTELFSNSPMWWQLKNYNPSGSSDSSDNLSPSKYSDHADYLANVAYHAAETWGVQFNSVSCTKSGHNC